MEDTERQRTAVASSSDQTLAERVAAAVQAEEVPMMTREQLQELMHSVLFIDLLASIMALLDVKHRQARRVCSTWHAEWWATDTVRRGLRRQVSPPVLMPHDTHVNDIIALDDERLCLASTRGMGAGAGADGMRVIVNMHAILDPSSDCQPLTLHCSHQPSWRLAAGNGRIFSCGGDIRSYRVTDYSMVAARAPSAPFSFFGLALAPVGPLFAVERMEEREWIVALDPGTLETRLTFGDFQSGALHGMAVVGKELYVGHEPDCSIRVFSFTGEPLRQITGAFRVPHVLRYFMRRLYLLEYNDELPHLDENGEVDESEEVTAERYLAGTRVFVLTPEGDQLQVYDLRPQLQRPGEFVFAMNVFGGQLLIATSSRSLDNVNSTVDSMFALSGV